MKYVLFCVHLKGNYCWKCYSLRVTETGTTCIIIYIHVYTVDVKVYVSLHLPCIKTTYISTLHNQDKTIFYTWLVFLGTHKLNKICTWRGLVESSFETSPISILQWTHFCRSSVKLSSKFLSIGRGAWTLAISVQGQLYL